jgi:uncharacterized protein (TIGR02058 family)
VEKVLFVEVGMGIDLHGQDVTTACVRAVWNAIGHNSMPGITQILPTHDVMDMKIRLTLGVPYRHEAVDVEQVKRVFPYGTVHVSIVQGGLLASSGILLPDKGDQNEDMVIVNAVVEVGY